MNQTQTNQHITWLYKLAIEQYKGDINLLLLELNANGQHKSWLFIE